MSSTLGHLSPARQRLVRLMQRVNFGRIENLLVVQGEPMFKPAPRTVRAIKLGGDNGPRPESALRNFALAKDVTDMLKQLSDIGDGCIQRLDVRHGLPFFMEVQHEESDP